MPTTTLFQTLQLGQDTWYIETVVPVAYPEPSRVYNPVVDDTPTDPWPDAPTEPVAYSADPIDDFTTTRRLYPINRIK